MTQIENSAEKIRKTVQDLVEQLVDHPAEVMVNVMVGEQATVYEVQCNPRDRGKIIGKAGKMAACLRHIVVCMAARAKIRATLEIVD